MYLAAAVAAEEEVARQLIQRGVCVGGEGGGEGVFGYWIWALLCDCPMRDRVPCQVPG